MRDAGALRATGWKVRIEKTTRNAGCGSTFEAGGKTLKGTLANIPQKHPAMKPGQAVVVQERDVADFVVVDETNGTTTGNYTGETYE